MGSGVLKVSEVDGEICLERVLIDDLIVDRRESRLARPKQLHQYMNIDRDALAAMFPDHKEAIASLPTTSEEWVSFRELQPREVRVIESWHLPSGPGAKDGRHSVVAEGLTLLDAEWTKDHFPFAKYDWEEPLVGWYGKSLVETLAGIQYTINKLNRVIREGQDLIARPVIFVDLASKVNGDHLATNEIGKIVYYRGKVPTYMTPQAFGPEIYQYKEQLKAAAYQFAGISEMSSHGVKQPGVESAVAIRELTDIESARFAIQTQRYEQFFIDVAHLVVETAREMYVDDGKDASATWKTRKWVKKIRWSEVNLDEDRFEIGVQASSILSRTPAGRLQGVVELAQSGILTDRTEIYRLLGHPDLQRSESLMIAAYEDIEATISDLLRGEEDVVPEPFQDLQRGVRMVQLALLNAKRDGAPEDVLERCRIWIQGAQDILATGTAFSPDAPPPAAPPVAGMAEQAMDLRAGTNG
jgi:hypothetical protein